MVAQGLQCPVDRTLGDPLLNPISLHTYGFDNQSEHLLMELLPMSVWVHMAVTMELIGIPLVLKVSKWSKIPMEPR